MFARLLTRAALMCGHARAQAEDTLVVAQRKEEAKLRVKAAKEQQLKEAREAATAKILSGDTSRKKQAAKAQKEQEARARASARAGGGMAGLTADAPAQRAAGATCSAARGRAAAAGLCAHQARPHGRRGGVCSGRGAVLGSCMSARRRC